MSVFKSSTLGLCAAFLVFAFASTAIAAESQVAANPCAANPCGAKANPCGANPCGAKANPCGANPCGANPCGAKANPCGANPCGAKANPCGANPCGAKANPCAGMPGLDPKLVTRPAGTSLAKGDPVLGEKLFKDTNLSTNGLACQSCHEDNGAFEDTFAKPYPHYVAMAKEMAKMKTIHLDEMVQICMVAPMEAKPLPWDSKELAALTAYVAKVQKTFTANPCGGNPCGGKNPCGK